MKHMASPNAIEQLWTRLAVTMLPDELARLKAVYLIDAAAERQAERQRRRTTREYKKRRAAE